MLIENERISQESFLREFDKRFRNFCQKSPLMLSYKRFADCVTVTVLPEETSKQFPFDFAVGVKTNIRMIKEWLIEHEYPRMVQVIETRTPYSPQELNELVSRGEVSLDQISGAARVSRRKVEWRIERVIVDQDRLFVRNLQNNEVNHYKLRASVVLFLKRLREGKLSGKAAWDDFESRAVLLGENMERDYRDYSREER